MKVLILPNRKVLYRREIFVLLVSLVPPLLIVVLINQYAVNVPYWDAWNWLASHYAPQQGSRLSAYWALHNEHRVFVSLLIDRLVNDISSLNMVTRAYLKIPFSVASFLVLYMIYRATSVSQLTYVVAIPFSLLTFSLAYWPMWIDSRLFSAHLSTLGFYVALWAIVTLPQGWQALGIAMIATLVASLSYSYGNVAWFVLGVVIRLVGYRKLRYYVAWTGLTLAVLVPYVIDFLGSSTIARTSPIAGVTVLIPHVVYFISGPLMPHAGQVLAGVGGAMLVGVMFVAFSATRLVKGGFSKALPWLGIMGWVVLNALAAALGRASRFGLANATAVRYGFLASQFWVAAVALIATLLIELPQPRSWKKVTQVLVVRMVATALCVFIAGEFLSVTFAKLTSPRFDDFSTLLLEGRECLLTYEEADSACLQLLHPDATKLRMLIPLLEERNATFLAED